MKLSQLKQIIKEEINELGFDYPGKEQTPSAYQNGIMDTLKAMQQLGHNIDIQAVMDIIYPDDENPINEAQFFKSKFEVIVKCEQRINDGDMENALSSLEKEFGAEVEVIRK